MGVVDLLGQLAQIKALQEGGLKQYVKLMRYDIGEKDKSQEDICPICGDPNQNGLGFCCSGHRDLHYPEHEPNLHQEDDKPSNPFEFYDIDCGMGIKE